jgi:hypothetical protein
MPHNAHYSGHPSRLNRSTLSESYRFGDISYAKEELRAELASLFLAAERGIPHDPAQHAAYVSSWIRVLKQDKNEIFRAAHDASRAADFLLAFERDRSIADKGISSACDPTKLGGVVNVSPNSEMSSPETDRGDQDPRLAPYSGPFRQPFEGSALRRTRVLGRSR